MSATASRLPTMMPSEPITPRTKASRPLAWRTIRARVVEYDRHHDAALANLQAQFDILAGSHADALDMIATQALRIAALEAKIKLPKRLAEVEPFSKVIPATGNAPARRCFDAAGFLAAIAERQRG